MPPLFFHHSSPPVNPPFEMGNIDGTAQSVKNSRSIAIDWWKRASSRGEDPIVASLCYVAYVDRLLDSLLRCSTKRLCGTECARPLHFAVMALGGYGRKEMGPYSDLDLLFLCEEREEGKITGLTDGILYPLWDAGFDVTAVTRSLDDCHEIMKKDVKALSSMLDARAVVGSEDLSGVFQSALKSWFSRREVRRNFVRHKSQEYERRRKRYGDSVYLREPDIKEGEGGLRDFHTLVWLTRASIPDGSLEVMLSKAGLTAKSIRTLSEAMRFVWRIRHALHLHEGKRRDRLIRDSQAQVAAMLGMTDTPESSAAESLMQQYYRHASAIHLSAEWVFERVDALWKSPWSKLLASISRKQIGRGIDRRGGVLAISEEGLKNDPTLIFKTFLYAKENGLRLDADSKQRIAEHCPRRDENFLGDESVWSFWRSFFERPDHIGETLSQMHECGCLSGMIPEMRPLMSLIPKDGYHIYTVDVHTIHAMRELSSLATAEAERLHPAAARAMRELDRPCTLLLAALLHDIGKGQGADHSNKGALTAASITRRMGFTGEDADEVAHLVKSHMLLPKLAFGRDIGDQNLISRFAEIAQSPRMLSMLYLLTFADLKSVGPHVWSAWKESLLTELYLKAMEYMRAGGVTEERLRKLIAERVNETRKLVGDKTSRESFDGYLSDLPKRYILNIPAPLIAEHVLMLKRLSKNEPVICSVHHDSPRDLSELSIVTYDMPGIFSHIAGLMSANGLNIIDADLYTTSKGIALDIVRFTDVKNRQVNDAERIGRIVGDIKKLNDVEWIERTLKRRLKPAHKAPADSADTVIEIDNDVSAEDTVLEIQTFDRPGLLYSVARAIAELDLSIDRAKIATHIDRVVDVFYIRDKRGNKITDVSRLASLKEILYRACTERRQ